MNESTFAIIRNNAKELQKLRDERKRRQLEIDCTNARLIVEKALDNILNWYIEQSHDYPEKNLSVSPDSVIPSQWNCTCSDDNRLSDIRDLSSTYVLSTTTIELLKAAAEKEGLTFKKVLDDGSETKEMLLEFSIPVSVLNDVFFGSNAIQVIEDYSGKSSPTFKELHKKILETKKD